MVNPCTAPRATHFVVNNVDLITWNDYCEFWNKFDAFKVVVDALNLLLPWKAWKVFVTSTLLHPNMESLQNVLAVVPQLSSCYFNVTLVPRTTVHVWSGGTYCQ